MSLLAEILSSQVRAAVFQTLFDGRLQELHMRELERRTGCAIGTIQTEMKKLTRLDLVANRRDGNRLYFRANQQHPLYGTLIEMVDKTVGITGKLRDILAPREDLYCAFVFGSFALANQKALSDIDLMVIGKIGVRALIPLLRPLSEECGREINPHVMTVEEFKARTAAKEHFVSNVMQSPKIFIKGGEDDLAEVAGSRVAAPA